MQYHRDGDVLGGSLLIDALNRGWCTLPGVCAASVGCGELGSPASLGGVVESVAGSGRIDAAVTSRRARRRLAGSGGVLRGPARAGRVWLARAHRAGSAPLV